MQVLSPNSEQARFDIEIASDQFFPKILRFVVDGAQQLFITQTAANDPTFAPIKWMIDANTHLVEYVPPQEEEEG